MEIRFSILLLLLLFILHSSMCVFIIILVTEAITAASAAAKFKNLNDFPLDLSIITLDGVYRRNKGIIMKIKFFLAR